MKRRTYVLGMGTVTLGGSAVLGTGAYSRTGSERGVTIETVGDENAYLRLKYNDEIEFDCEVEQTLLWVTNQLKSTITEIAFDVVGTDNEIDVSVDDIPETLEVGEKGEVVATLSCHDSTGDRAVNFDIEVGGEDLGVTAHRTDEIAVVCSCTDESAWALRTQAGGNTDPTDNRLQDVPDMNTNRWGWYVPYELGSGPLEAAFWAGAGNNELANGTQVGSVQLSNDGEMLSVELTMFEDVSLFESHLFVGTDVDQLSDTNGAPGQFGYDNNDSEFDPETMVYSIPLADVDENLDAEETLILAVHGVVSG